MKKILSGIVLGWVLHMGYLDSILLYQMYLVSSCDMNEQEDENGELPCLRHANQTSQRFYSKYFGAYLLMTWPGVVLPDWTVQ